MSPPPDPDSSPQAQRSTFLAKKLGLRLAWLHSLPAAHLRRLKDFEDTKLLALEAQIRSTTALLANASQAESARKELQRLHLSLFAPVTTGVHLHDDSRDAPQWNRFFTETYISAVVVADVSAQDLKRRFGVQVRCQAGDSFTALIPMSALENLADSKLIRKVELAHGVFPDLDYAIPFAQISTLHAAGHEGKNVLVGIIDDGLDLVHPDFQIVGATGLLETRVRYLWHQAPPLGSGGTPPPTDPVLPGFQPRDGASYGAEIDHTAINDSLNGLGALAVTPPIGEHGTTVTGCAAGNGRAYEALVALNPTDARIHGPGVPTSAPKGSAPKADILFVARAGVAGSSSVGDSSAILDAFHYLFARADELGQACVVNLSQSDDQGGHDGRSEGEKHLDKLLSSSPGRAITLSAGNSNGTLTHASASVSAGGTRSLELEYFPNEGMPTNSDAIEIWFPPSDFLSAVVNVPVPDAVAGTTSTTLPELAPGGSNSVTLGNVQILLLSETPDLENGDNRIQILITPILTSSGEVPAGWQVPTGLWKITLVGKTIPTGSTTVHAWIDRNNRGRVRWTATGGLADGESTISVPATAALPIAVAAHDKNDPPTVPDWFETSGRGPVRPPSPPGPIKPDISTVGRSTLAPQPTVLSLSPDFPYANSGGTSIAAPIVAGTCALAFECRSKHLSSEDLKFLLKSSAHSGLAVNDSGAGYLQAADLCTFEMVKVGLALTPTLWDSESPGVFWRSPHYEFPPLRPIVDLDLGPGPILGPLPPSPEEFEITLRNVSGREIEGARIEVFWAKPTTSLESEEIWSSAGILFSVPADAHGSTAAKLQSGNRIDLPAISAGRRSKFRFAWDGSKIEWPGKLPGDRPCFLARVTDSKSAARTKRVGRTPLALDASCALHSVVSRSLHRSKPAEASFEVRAMGGDSLHVTSELVEGRVVLELPVRALPWRDMVWIEKNKSPLSPWDDKEEGHLPETPRPLAEQETRLITDIRGAESLTIQGSVASVVLAEKVRGAGFVVPELRTAKGAGPIPMRLRVEGGKVSAKARAVHVLQMAKGRRVGGISLELHDPPEEGSA